MTRKAFKFSGLVEAGTIAPLQTGTAPHLPTEVSQTQTPLEAPHQEGQAKSETIPPAATGTSLVTADNPHPADWQLVDGELITGEGVYRIPCHLVDDSPFQPEAQARDRYKSEGIDDLAHTLASAGQKEAIIVRKVNGRFELIAGHRRIRAARSLGWEKIKAIVIDLKDDREAEKTVMVHNEGHKNLSEYAKAKLYLRAKQQGFARTQSEIAHMFATSQGVVSKRLAMLDLPQPFIDLLESQNDLFGMHTSATIHDLLAEHPNESELIFKSVLRIKNDAAQENSVRGWVSQMLQSRAALTQSKSGKSKPKVITDIAGRQLYTAKLEGRVITLRISATELDPTATLDAMVEYLQAEGKKPKSE